MTYHATNNAQTVEVSGESPALAPSLPEPTVHSTGAGVTSVAGPIGPNTNAVPPAIQANWGRIAQARLPVHMYRSILRIATLQAPALVPISLAYFLEFWRRVAADAVEPELVLAPDGTVHAEWFRSPRQRLDVRFAASGKAVFGLFANTDVLEGAYNTEAVATLLAAHPARPLQWSAK